ncbi:hypothetical protein DOY81_003492 [Sarcophaga bullata]|nr:hypothetical protein DOY81_003492 [Sarcophaga bullata]
MHRWFFADDQIPVEETSPPPTPPEVVKTSSITSIPDTNWTFCVKCDRELCYNEYMAVCGNIPHLGQWNPNKCLILAKEDDNSKRWSVTVLLPRQFDIQYRYLVCVINANDKKILRFWESHESPRLISRYRTQNPDDDICETFGFYDNKLKIERGWIDSYITVVQFMFYEAPFTLQKTQDQTQLYVRVSPLKLKQEKECEKLVRDDTSSVDSSMSLPKSEPQTDPPSMFAFCEVALLQNQNGEFRKQPKFGMPCGPNDVLIFNTTLSDFQQTAYRIDLYKYSPKSASDVPPHHIGYQHVLAQELKGSYGTLKLTIMCSIRHRPIGFMNFDYLVVKPYYSYDFNMEKNLSNWNNKYLSQYIGHRGCGKSFWFQNDILRESTIDSFRLAFKHGADMVEFDVQLTKDGVPVIYHDFQLYISSNQDTDIKEYDVMYLQLMPNEIAALKPFWRNVNGGLLSIPLSKFTVEQLQRVRVYDPLENQTTPCPVEIKNNKPFITVEEALKVIDNKLGFLIELKWPQKFKNGSTQENFIQDFDKNEFVDAILNVILRKAGPRRIILLSYDADICSMIRFKQNRYPVVYMIHDILTNPEIVYRDPRGKTIDSGIYFAKAMQLLGISANCDNIFALPGKVSDTHKRGLTLFTWGEQLRSEESRRYLKKLDVDGLRILFVLTNQSGNTMIRAQILTLICSLVIVLSCASPTARKDEVATRKFQINLNQCKDEVGATIDDLQDLLGRKPPSSVTGKCLRSCLMKKYKVMDSNGKFDRTAAMDEAIKLTHGDPAKMQLAQVLMNACSDIEVPADHCEAAAVYGQCFREQITILGLNKN